MGAGKGLSQDSLLVSNWDAIPGTELQKTLAIQNPGKWVQIADSMKASFLGFNKIGVREIQKKTIIRLISYDGEKLLYKEKTEIKQKISMVDTWLLTICIALFLIFLVLIVTFIVDSLLECNSKPYVKLIMLTLFVMVMWDINRIAMIGGIIVLLSKIIGPVSIIKKIKKTKKEEKN